MTPVAGDGAASLRRLGDAAFKTMAKEYILIRVDTFDKAIGYVVTKNIFEEATTQELARGLVDAAKVLRDRIKARYIRFSKGGGNWWPLSETRIRQKKIAGIAENPEDILIETKAIYNAIGYGKHRKIEGATYAGITYEAEKRMHPAVAFTGKPETIGRIVRKHARGRARKVIQKHYIAGAKIAIATLPARRIIPPLVPDMRKEVSTIIYEAVEKWVRKRKNEAGLK